MINRVVLVGRLTKDPDYRKTQGKSNTRFTLAVQRTYESSDGQSADFINCVVWNKTAENVEKYCHKGSLVGIDGHLRTRNYESDGQRKYVTEINCDRVSFLEPKGIKHNDKEEMQQKVTETTNSTIPEDYRIENEEMKYFDIEDDDIQF